jgi:hypothetical protein
VRTGHSDLSWEEGIVDKMGAVRFILADDENIGGSDVPGSLNWEVVGYAGCRHDVTIRKFLTTDVILKILD